jgi:cell division septal protein FtsQ
MTVKATTERNFRRARVRPAGRRRNWFARGLSWRVAAWSVGVLVAIYAGYRGAALVLDSPLFQIRRISVEGNLQLSGGEVHAIVDGLQGSNILTADLRRYRHRLMQSPWVADVGLRRLLPSTIEIFVSERRPMGLCRLGSTLYLVDPRGTIIDEYGPQYAEFDLPIIDGLVRRAGSGQPAIDEQRADLANRVVDALAGRKDLAERVSQIDVGDPHDAVVLLENDPALLHLGDGHFLERIQSYEDLAPALHERVGRIDYADMRFDERVYVRPAAVKGKQP